MPMPLKYWTLSALSKSSSRSILRSLLLAIFFAKSVRPEMSQWIWRHCDRKSHDNRTNNTMLLYVCRTISYKPYGLPKNLTTSDKFGRQLYDQLAFVVRSFWVHFFFRLTCKSDAAIVIVAQKTYDRPATSSLVWSVAIMYVICLPRVNHKNPTTRMYSKSQKSLCPFF